MSTHRQFDRICAAVLVCTVLLTILFMNGSRLGLETVKDGDAADSTDSAYFTRNDRDGSWSGATATGIRLSGDGASVSGGGAYVYDGDVVIARAGRYVVSGTLEDGSIRVSAESGAKVWLMLNGASVSCSDDAAIRIEQADKVFLTLAEGTENSLTSGDTYSESALADNVGGALFSRDDLTVNGSGSLHITAGYRHGIDANDELVITGGEISIEAPGDGIHVNEGFFCENAALTVRAGDEGVNVQGTEAELCVTSGSFDIDSTGAALKCANNMLLTGGSFALTTQADGIHSGGSVAVLGGDYTIRAADDGIHADAAVSISDGRLLLEECYEGIEALTIDFSGGELEIYSGDDGLNANGGSPGGMFMRPGETAAAAPASDAEAETWIHISGGSITVVNDTARDADGLDSNGDIVISGGSVRVSLSSSGSNSAIDYGSESGGSCVITGGDVVACGSSMMAEGFSDASIQCSIFYNLGYNVSGETTIRLLDADGKELLNYTAPCPFSSVTLSSPEMKLGETYTLMLGDKEEQITLESVSTTCGESGMGGMGWGSMRQRSDNGEGGENFHGRGNSQGMDPNGGGTNADGTGNMSPDMGGERPNFGEGFTPPDMGQDFGGPTPPDMSFPPQGADGGMTPPQDMNGGRGQMNGRGQRETQTPAQETPAEEAPAETAVIGPQPVSRAVWLMVGACTLALILGILFAAKYRP